MEYYCLLQSTGCSHLSVPLVVSEQSPQSLGHTVKEVEIFEAVKVIAKEQFSMVVPELEATLNSLCDGNLASIVLCGMEVSQGPYSTGLGVLRCAAD